MIAIIVLQCVYVQSAWRQFLWCTEATYSSSIHAAEHVAVQVCFAQGLMWRHITPVQHGDECQPKQRSGNNRVYIPTSSLCDPICFVIISLPLRFSIEAHNQRYCLCSVQEFFFSRLPPSSSTCTITHSHYNLPWKMNICVPPRKVLLLTDKGNCSKSYPFKCNLICHSGKHSHPKQ